MSRLAYRRGRPPWALHRKELVSYLGAVQHRNVLEIIDLVEEVLVSSHGNAFFLSRGWVVESRGDLAHLGGR